MRYYIDVHGVSSSSSYWDIKMQIEDEECDYVYTLNPFAYTMQTYKPYFNMTKFKF